MTARTLALFALLAAPAAAQTFQTEVRTEAGWFNKAYQDREYVSPAKVSFGTPYWAVGGDLKCLQDHSFWGADLAQTTIGAGSVNNFGTTESQPFTVLTFAGVYAGRDEGDWEWSLGVGALVHLEDFGSETVVAADGTTSAVRSGFDWNRRETFTVLTGRLRVFPVTGPHLAVVLAQGPLSLTEDLFHAVLVWPLEGQRLDAALSFSSPWGYWSSDQGILRCNERLSVGWSAVGPWGSLGARVGVLIRPEVAGTGDVDLVRRLSVGLEWGWP